MSSNNYQIYANQTLQLASTIVIKSSYSAEAINLGLIGASGGLSSVDPDPSTWKYYLNLAGQYHESDEVMTVRSMDTLEEIVFNKENLKINTATARAYQYGTRQYAELVAQYPEQEQLILGILYPVDLQTAIDAPDGQILSFPPNLVEENEYDLIERLQEWVFYFKKRWYINAFDLTDDLHHATHLGIMYLLLVQAIHVFRLEACNTNQAHSFHVKSYLGSHGYLDTYVDSLTTKQALYFYRNIAYIERNVGKRDTFDTLTDHIMTERSIPLAEYTMKHDTSVQPEAMHSAVVFRKKQLNLGIELDPSNSTTVKQLLTRQLKLAPGNAEAMVDAQEAIKTVMENSLSNVVATKTLESSMIDETNSTPWNLNDVLFNEWLDLSDRHLYTAYINIENPVTGVRFPLIAKEAFILAMYAYAKTLDQTLVTIPFAYANHVQRIASAIDPTGPTVDDIYSVVDQRLVPRDVAESALSIQPTIRGQISIDGFYNQCTLINTAIQAQRFLTAQQQNYMRRGMVQSMCSRIYCDRVIELAPAGTRYDDWLSDRSINFDDFKRSDFELLYQGIVSQATGIALHPTQSLKELQAAMVRMFTQLSSYGIQVIAEINDSTIRKVDWPGVRLGKVSGKLFAELKFPDIASRVIRNVTKVKPKINVDMTTLAAPNLTTKSRFKLHTSTQLKTEHGGSGIKIRMRSNIPRVKVTGPTVTNLPRGWVPFIGIENILALTPEQLASIRDVYTGGIDVKPPGLIPLSSIVLITELLPFNLGDRQDQLERSILNTLLGRTYPE